MKYRLMSRQYWCGRVMSIGSGIDIGLATEVLRRLRQDNAAHGVRADYWIEPA